MEKYFMTFRGQVKDIKTVYKVLRETKMFLFLKEIQDPKYEDFGHVWRVSKKTRKATLFKNGVRYWDRDVLIEKI